jgi:hypothetical protein
VHAAAAVLLRLCGVADVLDHGAADDVLEGGLRGFGGLSGGGGGLGDEGLQDILLAEVLVGAGWGECSRADAR